MKKISYLVCVAALVSCLPLIFGFPHGHDFLFEVPRIAEYRNALAAGQWPPYWAANLYGGFGSPIFLFYSPLFMAVATLLSLPLDSVLWGATLALIVFSLLSVLLVMGMVRSALDSDGAIAHASARVAAYLYVLSPYLIGDKLLRNANAEFTALCVAPLAFWGLFLIRSAPRRGALLLAAGLFLTVISHNLTALAVCVLVGMATLVLYFPTTNPRPFLYAAGGVMLALAMSAFLWLPVLVYKSQMQVDHLTTGRFDFHQLFAPLERVFSYAGYSVGWLPLAVLVLAAIAVTQRTTDARLRRLIGSVLFVSCALVFLQTRASIGLWEQLPWLSLFQFPWRMMGPLSLMTALAGAVVFTIFLKCWPSLNARGVEAALLALCIANAIPHLLAYEAVPPQQAALVQAGLTPDAIRASPFTTTVYDEYLPRGAAPTLWQQPRIDRGPVLGSDAPVQWEQRPSPPGNVSLVVTAEQAAVIHLARWQYPVWALTVNGVVTEPFTSPWRTVDVAVPAGSSTLVLELTPPPIRIWGLWVSLMGIALWMLIAIRGQWPWGDR